MSRDYTEITDEQLRTINKRAIEQPSYDALREQNRVLASHLRTLCSSGNKLLDDLIGTSDSADSLKYHIKRAQAALTAASQPAKEPVRHLCGARGFGQSLDDRCPGCAATSQEGQHG